MQKAGAGTTEYAVWLLPDMGKASPFMKEVYRFFKACLAHPKLSKASGVEQSGSRFHITLADFFAADFGQVAKIVSAVQKGAQTTAERYINEDDEGRGGVLEVVRREGLTLFVFLKCFFPWLEPLRKSLLALDCYTDSNLMRGEDDEYNATLLLDNQPTTESLTIDDFRDVINPNRYPLLEACINNDPDEYLRDEWMYGFNATRWQVAVMKRKNDKVEIDPGAWFPLYD
ncbi:hypothetical protein SARC_11365 [Sphaeroforma arctica JP610]|uniref:Uncharacterized protein n=1 Tax=Sphaeroforma arctica JP610 TaxID=667725 RepID=A0A0L0FHA8_9EUKA|nr:hypothetical protein SARC_11365 [Sphaeroforma arctica JP610]KNC76125.1 hypothetical protein SARC_11365 [Sphaeroforma arctica JP610]|eukprot:XP_014150027.1 hypothetical protein SARC_11365 [Sphaeroforma arctica JP610]